MARITASHAAGLDLIDKLFFNQILVQCLFTEELGWLKDLDADLDRELTHKGVTGDQRQVVRHGVLCMMEAELSESLLLLSEAFPDKLPALPDNITMHQFKQVERHNLCFFQAVLLAMLNAAHECDKLVVIEITNALLGKYKNAPPAVRYRLVERMFSYEFMSAPIDCFTWLAKMGVLSSTKHPSVALEARYEPKFIQRLALLCEIDMQRDYIQREISRDDYASLKLIKEIKNIPEKTRKLLLAQAFKLIETNALSNLKHSVPSFGLAELENSASIQRFFNKLNTYSTRFRVFQGSLASWTGMLCGGYVEVLDRRQDQKNPIYCAEANKKKSLTQVTSENMSACGFEINARTIYERHRDFKETILKIVTMYYDVTLLVNVAIPPYMNDLAYYGLTPQFGQFKPKPRRRPYAQV